MVSAARGFVSLRYAAAGLGALKALVLARLLDVDLFGTLALVLHTAAVLEVSTLGGLTGVLHHYFNDRLAGMERFGLFAPACAVWLVSAAVLALAVSSVWPVLFWAGILFLLNIPFILLEPMLRVRGMFAATTLPQIVVNLLSITLVAWLFWARPEPPDWSVLACIVAAQLVAQALFVGAVRWRVELPAMRFGPLRLAFLDYFGFIRAGFPLFVGSMSYSLLAFIDRFFIAQFYPDHSLGVYGLAFQVIVLSLVGLQAWAYVAATRIGQAVKTGHNLEATVGRTLGTAGTFAAASAVVVCLIALLFESTVYAKYEGLFVTVLVGCSGTIAYNAVSAAAAVLYYRGQQKPLHRALVCAIVINVALDLGLALAGAPFLWIVGCTSAIFWVLAMIAALLVRRSLRVALVAAPAVA